jgi:hypothetical protein
MQTGARERNNDSNVSDGKEYSKGYSTEVRKEKGHVRENDTVTWADVVKGVAGKHRIFGERLKRRVHSLETIQLTNSKFD